MESSPVVQEKATKDVTPSLEISHVQGNYIATDPETIDQTALPEGARHCPNTETVENEINPETRSHFDFRATDPSQTTSTVEGGRRQISPPVPVVNVSLSGDPSQHKSGDSLHVLLPQKSDIINLPVDLFVADTVKLETNSFTELVAGDNHSTSSTRVKPVIASTAEANSRAQLSDGMDCLNIPTEKSLPVDISLVKIETMSTNVANFVSAEADGPYPSTLSCSDSAMEDFLNSPNIAMEMHPVKTNNRKNTRERKNETQSSDDSLPSRPPAKFRRMKNPLNVSDVDDMLAFGDVIGQAAETNRGRNSFRRATGKVVAKGQTRASKKDVKSEIPSSRRIKKAPGKKAKDNHVGDGNGCTRKKQTCRNLVDSGTSCEKVSKKSGGRGSCCKPDSQEQSKGPVGQVTLGQKATRKRRMEGKTKLSDRKKEKVTICDDDEDYVDDDASGKGSHGKIVKKPRLRAFNDKYAGKNMCEICNRGFRYPSDLKRHSLLHNEPSFSCGICMAKFTYNSSKVAHMNTVHADMMSFKCDKCGIGFYTEEERNHHRLNYSQCKDRINLRCRLCYQRFTQESSLLEHEELHKGVRPFPCSICDQRFPMLSSLKTHEYTHPELGPKPHPCDMCDKRFDRKDRLKRHKAMVHEKCSPYTCDTCNKYFRCASTLASHKMTHTDQFRYLCSTCGYGCNWHSSFKTHMTMHTGEKKYRCTECSKPYLSSRALKLHMITHTGEYPNPCPKCPAKFRRLSHLNNHLLTHSGERPFKCCHCTKAFKRRDNLEAHLLTHTDLKPYKCDACEKRFNNASNLRSHMSRVHNEKNEYKYKRTSVNIKKKLGIGELVKSIEDNSMFVKQPGESKRASKNQEFITRVQPLDEGGHSDRPDAIYQPLEENESV